MYRRSAVSLVVVALLGLGAGPSCLDIRIGLAQGVVNLLPSGNGGFEKGNTTGWQIPGNVDKAEVVTQLDGPAVPGGPVEGQYCLYVENSNTSGEANIWDIQLKALTPNQVTLKAGKIYTFSGFFKSKSGTIGVRMLLEHNSGGGWPIIAGGDQITVTEEWTEFFRTTGTPLATDLTALQASFHFGTRQCAFWLDDVRLYEGEYVETVHKPTGQAKSPQPKDGAQDLVLNTKLSWVAGAWAAAHNVYLGENANDVNNASVANPGGMLKSAGQTATEFAPAGLEVGKTYYWRIDEVNNTNPESPWKGNVWSFKTEPVAYLLETANVTATASSESGVMTAAKAANGAGLNAGGLHSTVPEDMWLSAQTTAGSAWIQFAFNKTYKLHEMRVWNSNQGIESIVGFGVKDVTVEVSTDGTAWTSLGDKVFNRAPGTSAYAHNTTVDLAGAVAKFVKLTIKSNWGGVFSQYGLSEVQFYYIPTFAREPQPVSGSANIDPGVTTLSWRPGRGAVSHEVRVGTDAANLPLVGTVSATQFDLAGADLALGKTYSWRVDEVDAAGTRWPSGPWTFTVPSAIVVDNMESYKDDPKYWIYLTWLDGYEDPANGSVVGNGNLPELVIVHGGTRSMPMAYDNTGGVAFSEATRTFSPAQTWARNGITTLVVFFRDAQTSGAGKVYLKVNGTKKLYVAPAGGITPPGWAPWTQWSIDLASLGVNLKQVNTLTIGVEGAGAVGTLYVDDIQLYGVAPMPSQVVAWAEAESGTVTAPMAVYDDPLASGGKYIGTVNGVTGDSTTAVPAGGAVISLGNVEAGVYKVALRTKIAAASDSVWVRIPTATNYNPGRNANGWIRFNLMPQSTDWIWSDVWSDEHANAVVWMTVPAGPLTVEIKHREDGALVDAVALLK